IFNYLLSLSKWYQSEESGSFNSLIHLSLVAGTKTGSTTFNDSAMSIQKLLQGIYVLVVNFLLIIGAKITLFHKKLLYRLSILCLLKWNIVGVYLIFRIFYGI